MRESTIQAHILAKCGANVGLALFRNQVGVAQEFNERTGRTRVIRYGLCPSSADLVGIMAPTGRWVCLEVKRPGESMTPDQRVWAAAVRRLGGFVAEVHSIEEAENAIARARDGANQ